MTGEATAEGIKLTWMQDDFQTLAGYNVYRSDKEDGKYTRLNSFVLPVGEEEFFDTTVEPGVRYYYNFTVVKTDLTESTPSGKISIMSLDTMAPNAYHTPVRIAYTGSNLVVSATVSDNLAIKTVKLYFRTVGATEWNYVNMSLAQQNNRYTGIINADLLSLDGLEYYIEAFDGISYTRCGSSEDPYQVTVQLAVDKSEMGDVDGDGVITNKDALMLLQATNDLLNLTEEQFMRADLDGNGELTADEALRILQYVSGKITTIVG
jgi:fibronectin type 3 domain-containing protein